MTTFPSTHQQPSQGGTRLIDRETNISEVEVRTQREETRMNMLNSDNRDIHRDIQIIGIYKCQLPVVDYPHMKLT